MFNDQIDTQVPVQIDLDSLNDQQREAVLCTEGPLLVLAGAGSGKTRVLTTRIAHIISNKGVAPWRILAITFTKKAALEMRDRLEKMLPGTLNGMWVCTFHAMCAKILRSHAELLGYQPNFTILDDDDSRRMLKSIMADLDIAAEEINPRWVKSVISNAKNALITPDELFEAAEKDPSGRQFKAARIYEELQKRLLRSNAMDFDDLLVLTYELLVKEEDIAALYQRRFSYISVDEYQDTNHVQYQLTKILAAGHKNLMVVGDDDQSIYSWRGADIENILGFEKDYPEAKVVRLEQNYRSTGNILDAANAIIVRNLKRKDKRLFTTEPAGSKIRVYEAADDLDEARWIAADIERVHKEGIPYRDIAVFYRSHTQSRALEDGALRAGISYRIVGDTSFYQRAEIRDIMAYLKLVVNPADDIAAERVINTPRRGIGTTTVQQIRSLAVAYETSFVEACAELIEQGGLRAQARNGLESFLELISQARTYSGKLSAVVEHIIENSKLAQAYESEGSEQARERVENLKQFVEVARSFEEEHQGEQVDDLTSLEELSDLGIVSEDELKELELKPANLSKADPAQATSETGASAESDQDSPALACPMLEDFIEWVSLRSDLRSIDDATGAVSLMTIHAAKGLEFKHVYISGMEQGNFPLLYPGEEDRLEEERRLAYVACTRARQRLTISWAARRSKYGKSESCASSEFLRSIPHTLIEPVGIGSRGFSGVGWDKRGDRHGTFGSGTDLYSGRIYGAQTRSSSVRRSPIQADPVRAQENFEVGDRISHKTFGTGVVVSVSGDMLEITFAQSGKTKKLMKGFAPIVKLED